MSAMSYTSVNGSLLNFAVMQEMHRSSKSLSIVLQAKS